MTTQPKIDVSKLAKRFGTKQVLKEINLSIAPSESLCIIGTSGCGKSVLLKSILGLVTPDSGSIMVDGVQTVGQSRAEREDMLQKIRYDIPVWRPV